MNSSADTQTGFIRAIRPWLFVLLWLALASQVVWMALQHFLRHQPWGAMWYPIVFVLACLATAVAGGRVRWLSSLLRVLIALAFLEAVSDRFGLLGPPGSAGVSWGNFSRFVHYTGVVNSFLPAVVIPTLAVLATICEIVFGLAMLLGIRIRWAAAGSAALLFFFATAMTISGLSQFSYGVYLICAASATLSITDASFLSVDAGFEARKRRQASGDVPKTKI